MMIKRALIRAAKTEQRRRELERMTEEEAIALLQRMNRTLNERKYKEERTC